MAARNENFNAEGRALSFFCVKRKTPGVSVEPIKKLGYKGVNFCRVSIDGHDGKFLTGKIAPAIKDEAAHAA